MPNDNNILTRLQQGARDSTVRANEISTEYTNNLNTINGRVVVIAVGSASLLFTFIGILFGSDRVTSSLEYKYIILAIIGFLISSALLLMSGWFASLFRFNMASSHNLKDRISVREEEISIANAGRVVGKDGLQITAQEAEKYAKSLEQGLGDMCAALEKIKKAEKTSHILYRISLVGGYVVLLAAYAFTLVFFIGVINIINQ